MASILRRVQWGGVVHVKRLAHGRKYGPVSCCFYPYTGICQELQIPFIFARMAKQQDIFKKVISHCKEYGFVFQSSEIYEGLSAVYDYGPYGAQLKRNIKDYWWKAMVQLNEDIVGVDTAIFMHPRVWKASGHLEAFNDPLIDNKDSKKRYRADNLIEEYLEKQQNKIDKEVEKGRKKFGDDFDEQKFRETNPQVLKAAEKKQAVEDRFKKALDDNDLNELKQIIIDLDIADPETGSKNWTDVRQFNLMFQTHMGSVADEGNEVYLRPETAQGIYVNFLNVQKSSRKKVPFGIAQMGKSFRNEIVAGQFIFRTREFEQMEMQYFVKPGTEMEWYEHWKQERLKWHSKLFPEESLHFEDHLKPAHYANAAMDIEFDYPFGRKELEGIHSRTDYDLSRHAEYSGKKMTYYDPDWEQSYTPYVVETAIGLDRMLLAVISSAYEEEALEDGSSRILMRFPPPIAPVQLAILPLVRKDGLPDKAHEIFNRFKLDYHCQYEEKDSIGKRYRRQDAIGTPYCITVDHQTLEDNTVTLRERDSMQQLRVTIDRLEDEVKERVDMRKLLK